jgi:RNase adaptor protein for sRNA GlmZ degradation
LKQSEAKAKKYIECLNENRRQHALLQDKIKELDIAKSELSKLREVADRAAKIN